MTITDYATLQTAVASDLHRGDDLLLLAELPRCVQLAEADIFRELSIREIETSSTGSTTTATIPVPMGMASLERIDLAINGFSYSLDYQSPANNAALNYAGLPVRFTVDNGVINLLPAPSGPYSYTLYYTPDLSHLSPSNPTNWLVLNNPDVYFYATLAQATGWTRDPEAMQMAATGYQAALDGVRRKDARKRFPVSGGLQIKPRGVR